MLFVVTGMNTSHVRLRSGRLHEFATLVAIDDDACSLFVEAGRNVEMAQHHPFALAEQARWRAALADARVLVAVNQQDEPVGFASLGVVDGEAHLQQLSVRRSAMRHGLGRALVDAAMRQAGRALWLTTYADLTWNRPFYERLGFRCVAEADCGPEIAHILADERSVLPWPEQRVAMVRRE